MKAVPSGLHSDLVLTSWDRSASLDSQAMAMRKDIFPNSCFSEREPKSPVYSIQSNTFCIFHVQVYLGKGSVMIDTP